MQPELLVAELEAIEHSGRFVATGHQPNAPLLHIVGLGTLPLPIVPLLLPELQAAGSPAPYGRGPDTLVDAEVRRCHQVSAADVELPLDFEPRLQRITRRAATALGVAGKVEAHLYKLLVYGPGDFFVAHRDTEKEPGMFGTLVITLPGEFTGGELEVCHGDRAERFSPKPSAGGLHWAAFYADCTHEVRPLTTGARVALVYNLVRHGAPSSPSQSDDVIHRLETQLKAWQDDDPTKLVYVLQHRYSEAELSWDRLKGVDHGRAHALRAAASRSSVVAHLAHLSIHIEWSAEQIRYRSRRGRRGYDRYDTYDSDEIPDDLELYDEICDDRVLRALVDASDVLTSHTDLPLEEDEVWPEGAIDDERPDKVSYHEATGNEGATLKRMYRRAVVVLWPQHNADAVVAQRGLGAVVDALSGTSDRERVRRLVGHVLTLGFGGTSTQRGALLEILLCHQLIETAVEFVDAISRIDTSLLPGLRTLLGLLTEPLAADLVTSALARTGPWHSEASIGLLAIAEPHIATPGAWRAAMDRTTEFVPRWRLTPDALATLVAISWRSSHPGLTAVLEATLDQDEAGFDRGAAAAAALHHDGRCPPTWRSRILEGLEQRTPARPRAPSDLRRDPVSGCRCKHCSVLSTFLIDPGESVLTYSVRQEIRAHLGGVVAAEQLEVNTKEVRTGSPYKIVFTKNRSRYERARERFESHLHSKAVLAADAP